MSIPNLLNLGCGSRFRDGWVNVNFTSTGKDVIAADLGKGIPFPDDYFDAVYHSHLLEHISKSDAPFFMKECHRVLRKGGVIRVVVPDLEAIVKQYLTSLEQNRSGDANANSNHEWMMIELLDQLVRVRSGGEMAAYLMQDVIPNEDFVIQRCGTEVRKIIQSARQVKADAPAPRKNRFSLSRLFPRIRERLICFLLGDEECTTLKLGRFRTGGEVHKWMYDSISLGRLLTKSGFENMVIRSAT
jgi:predicted SAM-dependent methyltransferase